MGRCSSRAAGASWVLAKVFLVEAGKPHVGKAGWLPVEHRLSRVVGDIAEHAVLGRPIAVHVDGTARLLGHLDLDAILGCERRIIGVATSGEKDRGARCCGCS